MSSSFTVSVVGEYRDEGASQGLREIGDAARDSASQASQATDTLATAQDTAAGAAGSLASAQQESASAMDSASSAAEGLAQAQGVVAESATQAGQAQGQFVADVQAAQQACEQLQEVAGKLVDQLKEMGLEGLDLANQFEQTQERISNMGLTAEQSAQMMETMRQMSYDTGTSMSDLAQASEIAARAGVDVSEVLDEINILATATGKSVTDTAMAYSQASQGFQRGLMMLTKQYGITNDELVRAGAIADENGRVLAKNAEQQHALASAMEEVVNVKYADAIDKHSQSLQGAYDDLGSTVQRLKADFGASIAPVVETLANALTKVLKSFEALNPVARTTIEVVGAGAVLWVSLGKAVGVITTAHTALQKIMALQTATTTANTAATVGSTAAQTASAGAVTTSTSAWTASTAAIKGATAAAWAHKAALGELAVILWGVYEVTKLYNEAWAASAAIKDTNAKHAQDLETTRKKLEENKTAYQELTAELTKYGVAVNQKPNQASVDAMMSGGMSLEKLKDYQSRIQAYAEGATMRSLENPTNPKFKAEAEAARAVLTNVSQLVTAYEKLSVSKAKSAEVTEQAVKAPAKTAAQLQAEQDAKTEQRTSQLLTDLERERGEEVSKQGKDRLAVINEYLQIYRYILETDTEISDNAKARGQVEDKISELAKERQKIEQEILNTRTAGELEKIETNRARVVEKRGKTELEALDSAIAKTKRLLDQDSQIAKNAEARAKVEEKLVDYAKQRKQLEDDIARIRKESEDTLASAQEKYNQERQKSLEKELESMSANDPRRQALQSELDQRKAQTSQRERSAIEEEYNAKLKGLTEGSREYTNIENARTYALMAYDEAKKREATPAPSGGMAPQTTSSTMALMSGNDIKSQQASVTQASVGLDQVATASETAATSLSAMSNIDAQGVASALQSLTTAAMGAAGALSSLASASRSQSSGGNTYNQSLTINSQQQGLSVNTQQLVDQATAQVESNLSQASQYNGL